MLTPRQHLNTLIVEDSKLFLPRLKQALSEVPRVTIVAGVSSVSEARHSIESLAPDLVVLDLWLADASSVGLLRYLQQRGDGPKVFVLTSDASPEIRRACLALGAAGFFDKAIELEEFIEAVRTMAEERSDEVPKHARTA